jgi:DNA-binding XRE family transcriptional regulator
MAWEIEGSEEFQE